MNNSLRYPVLLVHGMGFRDDQPIGYWGRIPRVLEAAGATIFYGNQDSNASIENSGAHLARRIEEILAETGAEKVNVIAHSKGGLDARYAISTLGMGDRVASLTTMSTPHHGSKTVDLLLKVPDCFVRFAGFCTDCWFRLLGDKNPYSYSVFHAFRTQSAEVFNQNNPDDPRVYYQSYSFAMRHPFGDILLWFPALAVWVIEGENDGLLPPASTKWSNWKGVCRGVTGRGISHCDEVDLRRHRLTKRSGDGVSDITHVYLDALSELSRRGL